MIVQTDAGATIELGTTETAPTIGLVDFSRRATDDYGITTVVERGFSRRMTVRMALPFDQVDDVQRELVKLRAEPAMWIADDRFSSLSMRGFYKEFSLDLAVAPTSYCTLTVEGLAETGAFSDPGGDPAPPGMGSTFRLLQPVLVTDALLASSNVPETDYAAWSDTTSYSLGSRVVRSHTIYESARGGNRGRDPLADTGEWSSVGPTNRWAMFDQALGSSTTAASPIAFTVNVSGATAVAVVDVIGASVRVQTTGYDRTIAVGTGPVLFLDLPGASGSITITLSGTGSVSMGTVLIGHILDLGVTEVSPTSSIADFSRKDVDDFGDVSVVERAWAKRMSARALITTAMLDVVAGRISAVRAQPCLWIGEVDVDVLSVYGFFKDFSIEVGETVSKLTLSIEGLSTAPSPPAEQRIGATIFFDEDRPSADVARPGDLWRPSTGIEYEFAANVPAWLSFDNLRLTVGSDIPSVLLSAAWVSTTLSNRVDVAVSSLAPMPDLVIQADWQGNPADGQLPALAQARRLLGTDDVTDTTEWSLAAPPTIDAEIENEDDDTKGLVKINGPSVTSGDVIVTARRDGIDLTQTLRIVRKDAAPPSSGSTEGGGGSSGAGEPVTVQTFTPPGSSSTHVAAHDPVAVTVGSSGSVALSASLTFAATAAGSYAEEGPDPTGMAAKWRHSADGSTGWSDVAAETESGPQAYRYTSTSVPKGLRSQNGSFDLATILSSLAPGTHYFQLMSRYVEGASGVASLSGSSIARPL